MSAQVKQPVCLIAIDGWGISPNADATGDAIRNADTPVMDGFEKTYPFTKLAAHGLAVGLPDGLMGNSEVGHLNIGAGRVVYQDIVRIDLALKNRQFGQTENIRRSFEHAKAGNGRLHFLGLVSDGGVHSHINHLFGLLDAAKEAGVPEVYVHFFGDGRDTSPRSSTLYYQQLQDHLDAIQYGKVATITGRYYAMDRDRRWERIQIALEAIVHGKGEKTDDPIKTIEARFAQNETDEFLKPIIVNEQGLVRDDDTLFFFDFRSDRMRQITQAFGIAPAPFEIELPKNLDITTFTQYKGDYPFHVAFPPQTMEDVLAEWLSKQGVPQCHVAETEKYAHVTFFFNGGTEAQFTGEDRDLIASPKVATYDLQPEMSAKEVGDKVAEEIATGKYPFVMCNFAPPDMVGHTGQYDKAVKGVEATDKAIGVIYNACKAHGYVLFVTADHGNAEKMLGDNGQPHTAHTTAPVPFVMTSTEHRFAPDSEGALCDVAPTVLRVMGLSVPKAMTGRSLLAE
ncbi:2,3-bisphosphoglycerate-independent phosphoglycerate mutase [Thamnocephalis sphaerospora]|uniref:2,3-bisphosphoglycerate-independent phosphoglycerate mutase n=1 Tax=Thamnocephalis sphaerospora TaxID=78915 RepID=A0A4P9XX69_9FUNG|nr:2,3-bisphosphoglycerate-independent phosphoglycerate mutase [Thamnocephalis sphaerospora]|eukprot:RKP10956.1 2,3-bisphosphoglycerate-independent phosphoglycerate mutase [Thamnocephalis sphaerospora]